MEPQPKARAARVLGCVPLKTTLLIHLSTPWFKRGVLIEWGELSLRTDGFPMTVAIAGAVSSPPGGMPVAALTCRRFER